jgi:hypothetical protein
MGHVARKANLNPDDYSRHFHLRENLKISDKSEDVEGNVSVDGRVILKRI